MKKIITFIFLIFITLQLFAQSTIILPNGTVIPSFTQVNRPASGITGQLIYQTNGTSGLYVWNGTAWTAVSNSTAPTENIRVLSATDTLKTIDNLIICNSTTEFMIQVPDASTLLNKTITIKNINTGKVNLAPQFASLGQSIDGVPIYTTLAQYAAVKLFSNGTNWFIIHSNGISTNNTNPVVVITSLTDLTTNSVTVNGNAIFDGKTTANNGWSALGVVWATTPNPTLANNSATVTPAGGVFSKNITGLLPNQLYYVRAFGSNTDNASITHTGYGTQQSFTTVAAQTPTVQTKPATAITHNSATLNLKYLTDGNYVLNNGGFYYATHKNPTAADNVVNQLPPCLCDQLLNISGLAHSTKYYFRAFASNVSFTGIGDLDSLTTAPPATPILSSITENDQSIFGIVNESPNYSGKPSRSFKFNVVSENGTPITTYGICYATHTNPTIADSVIPAVYDGNELAYVSTLNLTRNTKYYVRAYAINGGGAGYSNEISFNSGFKFIGDLHEGGIVTYLDPDGIHGLVVDADNFDNGNSKTKLESYMGGNYNNYALNDSIGHGKSIRDFVAQSQNYSSIYCGQSGLNSDYPNYAIAYCPHYTYSNWYIPSKLEGYTIMNLLQLFPTYVSTYNFKTDYPYATSTRPSNGHSYVIKIETDGTSTNTAKTWSSYDSSWVYAYGSVGSGSNIVKFFYLRAVRRF